MAGFGTMYVPKTDTSIVESRPFLGNILTSDPVRYARNAAIIEAEPALSVGAPTVAWMDSAFRAMRAMRERSYPARIRQPMLIVAAGSDAVVRIRRSRILPACCAPARISSSSAPSTRF